MKTTSHGTQLILILATLALAIGAGSTPQATTPPDPQAAAGGEPAYLNCTVRSVDPTTRTVEVITGVGYALRQYGMTVAHDCEIVVAGTPVDLANLKPGAIIRVRYEAAPAEPNAPPRLMATAIETVHVSDAGGER